MIDRRIPYSYKFFQFDHLRTFIQLHFFHSCCCCCCCKKKRMKNNKGERERELLRMKNIFV